MNLWSQLLAEFTELFWGFKIFVHVFLKEVERLFCCKLAEESTTKAQNLLRIFDSFN